MAASPDDELTSVGEYKVTMIKVFKGRKRTGVHENGSGDFFEITLIVLGEKAKEINCSVRKVAFDSVSIKCQRIEEILDGSTIRTAL